jgi:hypothetical protein
MLVKATWDVISPPASTNTKKLTDCNRGEVTQNRQILPSVYRPILKYSPIYLALFELTFLKKNFSIVLILMNLMISSIYCVTFILSSLAFRISSLYRALILERK